MIEIREYTHYQEQEILRLYSSVGWTAYTNQPETLRKGFGQSLLTLAAYNDGELVGMIRTVGDGQTIVLIQDLLVLPAYQRSGIGSQLVKAVLAHFPHVRQFQLATDNTPKTLAFYRSLGFVPMDELGCCGLMLT